MLKYTLIEETGNIIRYEYAPEGGEETGVVFLDKCTGQCGVEALSIDDPHSLYAFKLIKRVQEMGKVKAFPKEGVVAWY